VHPVLREVSWTDGYGVTHAVSSDGTFGRCLVRIEQGHRPTRFDPELRPTTCLTCLVLDLDAAMLYALKEMERRGITVDQQILADLERKCNVH